MHRKEQFRSFRNITQEWKKSLSALSAFLQFDVLKYRLKNEYNVEILLENLPYEYIRWIESADTDLDRISGTSDMKKIKRFERPAVTFVHP